MECIHHQLALDSGFSRVLVGDVSVKRRRTVLREVADMVDDDTRHNHRQALS